MELVGPRTVEQLSKDYADLVRNARRVEGELLQTKTNLESCGLERNVARNEAKSCAAGYEDATQRGIAIERRAMLCQEQIEKCRELQRDYDTVVGENEYLKSEIQRLISGQPRQTLPLQSYERRLPPPPEKSGYRKSRRPLPPPESPVCVIL
jgi:chromosome segregation ATPase